MGEKGEDLTDRKRMRENRSAGLGHDRISPATLNSSSFYCQEFSSGAAGTTGGRVSAGLLQLSFSYASWGKVKLLPTKERCVLYPQHTYILMFT